MKNIESYLPLFDGFYNTHFEYNNEDDDIQWYNETHGTDLFYEDFDWNYTERQQRISKQVCDIVNGLLSDEDINMTINFQKLVSPKFYNFTNDSINCEYVISQKEYDKIIDYIKVNWSNFEEYIKDRYTSRSGFTSSHSNNAEVWMNNIKSESHLEHNFGTVLEFILQNEEYESYNIYEAITDDYIEFNPIEELV
tara:strand:+ start:864 stop:1448 length:585 start_codon:yes stop_codon:yes gene_type:complete